MQLRFPQRRDQQTWAILRFILPSQLGVKSTPNAETGGNKVKNYNETLPMALLAPQRMDTSSEGPESGRAGSKR